MATLSSLLGRTRPANATRSDESSNDLTPTRQLYQNPAEARKAILRVAPTQPAAVDESPSGPAYVLKHP